MLSAGCNKISRVEGLVFVFFSEGADTTCLPFVPFCECAGTSRLEVFATSAAFFSAGRSFAGAAASGADSRSVGAAGAEPRWTLLEPVDISRAERNFRSASSVDPDAFWAIAVATASAERETKAKRSIFMCIQGSRGRHRPVASESAHRGLVVGNPGVRSDMGKSQSRFTRRVPGMAKAKSCRYCRNIDSFCERPICSVLDDHTADQTPLAISRVRNNAGAPTLMRVRTSSSVNVLPEKFRVALTGRSDARLRLPVGDRRRPRYIRSTSRQYPIGFVRSCLLCLSLATVILFDGCAALPSPRHNLGHLGFIDYWPTAPNHGLRLAIKDNIDMQGVVTTAGSAFSPITLHPPRKTPRASARAPSPRANRRQNQPERI